MVPVVDDEDLKKHGHFSDESLIKRYREAKEHVKTAHPPKNSESKPQEISSKVKDYIEEREKNLADFSDFA